MSDCVYHNIPSTNLFDFSFFHALNSTPRLLIWQQIVNEKEYIFGTITSTAAIMPFIKETGTLPQNINWAVKADYLRPLIELSEAKEKDFNIENPAQQKLFDA